MAADCTPSSWRQIRNRIADARSESDTQNSFDTFIRDRSHPYHLPLAIVKCDHCAPHITSEAQCVEHIDRIRMYHLLLLLALIAHRWRHLLCSFCCLHSRVRCEEKKTRRHTHTQFNGLQQRKPDRNEKGRICIYICIYFSVQRWRWSGSHGINKLIFLWHRKCFRNCQPTAALMPFAFFASFGHCKLCLFFLCRHNLCIRIGSHGVWVRSVCQPVFFFAFSFKWRCEVNCVDCDLDRETCDGFW